MYDAEIYPVAREGRGAGLLTAPRAGFDVAGDPLYTGGGFNGAVVAEFSRVQLYNPGFPARIFQIMEIVIISPTAQVVYFFYTRTPFTNLAARVTAAGGTGAGGVSEVRQQNGAFPSDPTFTTVRIGADLPLRLIDRTYLLRAGDALAVLAGTANTQLLVTFTGREYPI